jgi:CheY-like chemotaxis protein
MTRGALVLVVEDEPLSRDVLTRMLRSRGFRTESVPDGPSCLEWLEENAPALVLLDVSMPGMSGLDVLKCLRRQYTRDQLPVILVTAMVDSDDVVAGLEAGANDYVVKPVNLPVLLARMSVALRIRQDVERLLEAERHRVMLESLDGACERLARPLSGIVAHLETILADAATVDETTRVRLRETLDWAREAGGLIGSFRRIASYQAVPYTEGIGSFVAASLESAARATPGDGPPPGSP